MKRRLIAFLTVMSVMPTVFSCRSDKACELCGEVKERWGNYIGSSDYNALIDEAKPVFEEAACARDTATMVVSGLYLAQAYLLGGNADSSYHYVVSAKDYAVEHGMTEYILKTYNLLGLYKLYYMDYEGALGYFQKAISYCEKGSEEYDVILSNVASVYLLRDDPSALAMAEGIWRNSQQRHDPYTASRSAYIAAYMCWLRKDYSKAEEYIFKCWNADTNRFLVSEALYGQILADLGRYREAESYFTGCLSFREGADMTEIIDVRRIYGNYLLARGCADSAVVILEEGLRIADSLDMTVFGYKLYEHLARAYNALGQPSVAEDYLKAYAGIADSLVSADRERAFNDLRFRYENQRHELRVKEMEIRLMSRRQQLVTVVFVALVLATAVFVVIARYRREKRLNKELVMRYKALLEREERQAKVRREAQDSSEEKLRQLFCRIEAVVKDDGLFKRSDLTREMVADMLGSNSVYVSKAVNFCTSESFNVYVNRLRVNAAVHMLSDPSNDMPIKAIADAVGYNNLQSFYKNFQKETGVPPSQYRKAAVAE